VLNGAVESTSRECVNAPSFMLRCRTSYIGDEELAPLPELVLTWSERCASFAEGSQLEAPHLSLELCRIIKLVLCRVIRVLSATYGR